MSDDEITLPPCEVLRDTVNRGAVRMPNGEDKKLVANISIEHSRTLYETVLREQPKLVIEIGMAQGVSTLSILCALKQVGGRLISIDPYVGWPSGRLAALHNIERAGYSDIHQHVEAKSYEALPKLLAEKECPQLAYIDGAHDFANAFIDFFYLDKMLPAQGVMGFNDTGWEDVQRVIRFLQKHHQYAELDVGLHPDYSGRTIIVSLARRLLNRPRQDRYFRKLGDVSVRTED
jgi:predicted O-methyltransferase YrrM